jgi:hypothetical protein
MHKPSLYPGSDAADVFDALHETTGDVGFTNRTPPSGLQIHYLGLNQAQWQTDIMMYAKDLTPTYAGVRIIDIYHTLMSTSAASHECSAKDAATIKSWHNKLFYLIDVVVPGCLHSTHLHLKLDQSTPLSLTPPSFWSQSYQILFQFASAHAPSHLPCWTALRPNGRATSCGKKFVGLLTTAPLLTLPKLKLWTAPCAKPGGLQLKLVLSSATSTVLSALKTSLLNGM